jgi:hypothetical protein
VGKVVFPLPELFLSQPMLIVSKATASVKTIVRKYLAFFIFYRMLNIIKARLLPGSFLQ